MAGRVIIAALGLGLWGMAGAADLHVGPGQTYATVGDALLQAAPGDRVFIAPGTYPESLVVVNDVELVGEVGGDPVVLASVGLAGVGRVLDVTGAALTLRDLVVDGSSQRAGIRVDQGSLYADGVTFRNGSAASFTGGGSVGLVASQATIVNSVFESGSAGAPLALGGHLFAFANSTLELGPGVTVRGGSAVRGGAIWADRSCDLRIDGVVFEGNLASGAGDNDGGGICVDGLAAWPEQGLLDVRNSSFVDNQAGLDAASGGGGIYSEHQVVVTDSTFEGGIAGVGSAVAVQGASLGMTGGLATGNQGVLGTVACGFSAYCALADVEVSGNTAGQGGGIYVLESYAELRDVKVCNNQAQVALAGALLPDGGGLRQQGGRLVVTGSIFGGNASEWRGGALALADVEALNLENNHVVANAAANAGAAIWARGLAGATSQASLVNDLYLDNVGVGPAVDGQGFASIEAEYSVYWGNLENLIPAGTLFNLAVDPLLVDASDPCDPAGLAPQPGSPLIDGGDPARSDADGSRSDIGAFGGPTLSASDRADLDSDGLIDLFDCDDADAAVGFPMVWREDADQDGFGAIGPGITACDPPMPGMATVGGDCDDADPTLNPDTEWWFDEDEDGLGGVLVTACVQPAGTVDNGDDCHDGFATIGGPELQFTDNDDDGFGVGVGTFGCPEEGLAPNDLDCDDTHSGVSPLALEHCNERDDDCNGWVDDDPFDAEVVYRDADGDGLGDPKVFDLVCVLEVGWVDNYQDCDDRDEQLGYDCDVPPFDPRRPTVEPAGCTGCSGPGGGPGMGWVLLGVLALARRRTGRSASDRHRWYKSSWSCG